MTGFHLAFSWTIPIKKTQYFTSWSILHWNWGNIRNDFLYWVKTLLSPQRTPSTKHRLWITWIASSKIFPWPLTTYHMRVSWLFTILSYPLFMNVLKFVNTTPEVQCPKLNPKADSKKLKLQAPSNTAVGVLEVCSHGLRFQKSNILISKLLSLSL